MIGFPKKEVWRKFTVTNSGEILGRLSEGITGGISKRKVGEIPEAIPEVF